jgi:putative ABC transport system permease protein
MFKNYLKIAVRQLLKQKMYSVIKVGGFSLGIAACLLITLYIRHEVSYDRHYTATSRIYRLVGAFNDNGKIDKGVSMPAPMARVLTADFPEIQKAARLMPNSLFPGAGSNYIRRDDQQQNTYETRFTYADQEFLDILEIPMVYGKKSDALVKPRSIVLSRKKAEKYFPGQNPVGKIIFLNDDKTKAFTIGGVMQDFPLTSHLQFDFILTLKDVELWPGEQDTWRASNYHNYVLVQEGTDIQHLEKKLTTGIVKNYVLPSMDHVSDKEKSDVVESASLHLQPVSDIHLRSSDIDDNLVGGDIRYIWLFGAIACFILIIACINFVNLSTARSANRAREVGLRKVIGSNKMGLIKQFLIESTLFSFLSFSIALLLARLLLPYFNLISGKALSIPWNEWWLIPIMISSAILIGIIAGLYPSFYLSAFKPISVLKGNLSRGTKNSVLRNGLVVFQFTTSIILIIGTVVIYKQMQFILNTKLGFEKDQVVLVEGANTLGTNVRNFKNELLKLSQVKSVSVSDYLPVDGTKRNGNSFWNEGMIKKESGVDTQFWVVDDSYLQTMGMKLISGRNFSGQIPSDSQSVIINQTMASRLNLKDPIGKRITNGRVFVVVGVVQDFNFESMRSNIEPVCLRLGTSPSIVSIKVATADMSNQLSSIASVWKKFAPSQPLRYSFLDEKFENMYEDIQRTGHISTSFSILAIIIACLGLFALSAFMAEQRSKEIGVRKVLGASVHQLVSLLSKDFLRLVIVAVILASPIAWWAMTKWLQDFAYRINISWWIFLVAGGSALLIALLTVSFQAVKAAISNPVKSLRTE